MPLQQITDGSPDGAQFPNTKLGFYGITPVAQVATSVSTLWFHSSGVVSAASSSNVAALVAVMNTLVFYGLWPSD